MILPVRAQWAASAPPVAGRQAWRCPGLGPVLVCFQRLSPPTFVKDISKTPWVMQSTSIILQSLGHKGCANGQQGSKEGTDSPKNLGQPVIIAVCQPCFSWCSASSRTRLASAADSSAAFSYDLPCVALHSLNLPTRSVPLKPAAPTKSNSICLLEERRRRQALVRCFPPQTKICGEKPEG